MVQAPSPLAKMKAELESMQQDESAFEAKIKQIEVTRVAFTLLDV